MENIVCWALKLSYTGCEFSKSEPEEASRKKVHSGTAINVHHPFSVLSIVALAAERRIYTNVIAKFICPILVTKVNLQLHKKMRLRRCDEGQLEAN